MRLRFLSRNLDKIAEAQSILEPHGVEVIPVNFSINEIQVQDIEEIAKKKAREAFTHVGRPLFVEHTGLFVTALGQLPGGLTQIFWDALQADRFCDILDPTGDRTLLARTVVAYCDGRTIQLFSGEIAGTVAINPRGDRHFQWDCVFIPDGHDKTFAEMGPDKNAISMRRIALDKMAKSLGLGK